MCDPPSLSLAAPFDAASEKARFGKMKTGTTIAQPL